MGAECTQKTIYISERLREALEYALTQEITVIEAPTGYGKTMAARQLEKMSSVPVKWVNAHDDDISHAWVNFCRAVFQDRSVMESLISWPFPEEGLQRTVFSDYFEAVLDEVGEMIIVFDDYQEIRSMESNTFLGYLIREYSESLRIVVISQRNVFLREDSMVASGKLFRIDNEVLRLTREDLDEYIGLRKLSMTKEMADELYANSEGWFCMVTLALNNYAASKKTEWGVDMEHLVERSVYNTLPAHIRYFLSFVAPLQDFTKEQADFFNGGEDATEILEWLREHRTFLDYDSNDGVYHIHSIFQKCIEHKFERMSQGEKIQRYERLAQFYIENKHYNDAILWYTRAGNFEGVMLTVELFETMCGPSEDPELVKRCFDACPKMLFEDYPYALVLFMWRFYTYGELDYLNTCEDLFQSNLRQISLSHSDRQFLEKAYCVFEAMSAFNDLDRMYTLTKKAAEIPGGELPVLDPSVPGNFGIPSLMHMFYRGEDGEELVAKMKRSLTYYDEIGMKGFIGVEELLEAERLYYIGDMEGAQLKFLYVKRELSAQISECFSLNLDYFLGHIAMLQGDEVRVKRILQSLRATIMEKWQAGSSMAYTGELVEALFYTHTGNADQVPEWISDPDAPLPKSLMRQVHPFAYLVRFNVLVANKRYEDVLSTKQSILHMIDDCGFDFTHASIFLCFAAAAFGLGHRAEAKQYVMRALRLIGLGYPVLYAMYADNLMDLFVEMAEELDDPDADEVLASCRKAAGLFRASKAESTEDAFPMLTKRENEVAALAIDGYTNDEIANRLFISKNTVKSTMKNIFGKLGIRSRRELVRIAQIGSQDLM